ncbi:MAG: hypothetical protein CRN43_19560 [Candidatus Nephrothrix sp. EaCA]|nr:MAG: hypothetical protein CRN43_19560 [Candidatus Nephrothrix sp. EaCA]
MKRRSLLWTISKTNPFWKTCYPPNHWNCRSAVRQLNSGTDSVRVTPEGNLKHIDIKPMFRINMVGLVFSPDHPYFKEAPEWVIKQGQSSQREVYEHISAERFMGKSIMAEGVGKVEITRKGIREILNQPIDGKLWNLKNHLVFVLDALLNNIESVSEASLSHKPKEAALDVMYRYLKFKGLPQPTGVLRCNQNQTIHFYSITKNKNAD